MIEALVFVGVLVLLLAAMAIFAIAEECVRLRRLRDAEEMKRELWRSGGLVKGHPKRKELS